MKMSGASAGVHQATRTSISLLNKSQNISQHNISQ